jgi:hypothetical protein
MSSPPSTLDVNHEEVVVSTESEAMGDAGVDDDLAPLGMLRFLDTAVSLVADTQFLLWN